MSKLISNKVRHEILFAKITSCLEKLSLPKIVILYGSFSKLEGSWDPITGSPYNDIDLIFIDDRLKLSDIERYKTLMLKEIKTDFIDISLYNIKHVSNLKPSIFSFDLFENGLILNGEYNLKKFRFSPQIISTKDIEILFKTRIWTFIGSYPLHGFINLDEKETLFFNYQMSKAIFAIIDCLLILKKEYVSKYKDKIIWAKKQKEFSEFYDFIDFAENVKVKGIISFNPIKNDDLIFAISKMFYKVFQEGLQNHYNSEMNLSQLVNWVYRDSFRAMAMKLLYSVKGVNGFEMYNLILVQYYLLEKMIRIDWDEKEFKKTVKKLNLKGVSIDELRIEIANKRL